MTTTTMPGAKLTEDQVLACRMRAQYGATIAALATGYGLGEDAMYEAVTGQTWAHLPGPVADPSRR